MNEPKECELFSNTEIGKKLIEKYTKTNYDCNCKEECGCPDELDRLIDLMDEAHEKGHILGLQEANEIIDNQENKCGIDSWDCETANAIRRKLKSAMKKVKE